MKKTIYINMPSKSVKEIEKLAQKRHRVPTILKEAQRNLVEKLGFNKKIIDLQLKEIADSSRKYTPHGKIIYVSYGPDNLVLETAIKGGAHVLVTGDKEDLLPLKEVKGVIIEPPHVFYARLKSMKLI